MPLAWPSKRLASSFMGGDTERILSAVFLVAA